MYKLSRNIDTGLFSECACMGMSCIFDASKVDPNEKRELNSPCAPFSITNILGYPVYL